MIAGDTKRNSQRIPRLANAALLEHDFGGNDES